MAENLVSSAYAPSGHPRGVDPQDGVFKERCTQSNAASSSCSCSSCCYLHQQPLWPLPSPVTLLDPSCSAINEPKPPFPLLSPGATTTCTADSSLPSNNHSSNNSKSRKRTRSGSPSRRASSTTSSTSPKPLLLGIFVWCLLGASIAHAQELPPVVNANQCKLSMALIADLNKDGYLARDAEYLTWLNRMPKVDAATPAFPTDNSMTFAQLPVAFQTLYNKYATAALPGDPSSQMLVWDIHGVQPGTLPTSQAQVDALTVLCEQDYGLAAVAAASGVDVVFGAPVEAVTADPGVATNTTLAPSTGEQPQTLSSPATESLSNTTTTIATIPATEATLVPTPSETLSEEALAGCTFEMYTSDAPPADNVLTEMEYIAFVNRLANQQFASATSLAELPTNLQQNFQDHVRPDLQGWNITGTNPVDPASVDAAQRDAIYQMCAATQYAIAASSVAPAGAETATPVTFAGSVDTTTVPPGAAVTSERPPTDVKICKLQMAVADKPPRDSTLDGIEYVTFVNKLAANAWADVTALEGLPQPLQDNFNSLATTTTTGIDITGALPNQVASDAQVMFLESTCSATDNAINQALYGTAGTAVGTPESASNGTTTAPFSNATTPPAVVPYGEETENLIPAGFDSATAVPLTIHSSFRVRNEKNITAKVLNDAKDQDPNRKALESAYQTFIRRFGPTFLASISTQEVAVVDGSGGSGVTSTPEENTVTLGPAPTLVVNTTQLPLPEEYANTSSAQGPLNATVVGADEEPQFPEPTEAPIPVDVTLTNETVPTPFPEATGGMLMNPTPPEEVQTPAANVTGTLDSQQDPAGNIFAQPPPSVPTGRRWRRRLQEFTNTTQPVVAVGSTVDLGNTSDSPLGQATPYVADTTSLPQDVPVPNATSGMTGALPEAAASTNATDAVPAATQPMTSSIQPEPAAGAKNTTGNGSTTIAPQPGTMEVASPLLAMVDLESAQVTRFEDAACPDASDGATCLVAFAQYEVMVSPTEDSDFIYDQMVNLTQAAIAGGTLQQVLELLGNSSGFSIIGAGPDPSVKTSSPTAAPQPEAGATPQGSNEGKIMGMPMWGFILLWVVVGLVVLCGGCFAANRFLRGDGEDGGKKTAVGGGDEDGADDGELEGGLLKADMGTTDDDEDFRDELHADLAKAHHQTLVKDAQKDNVDMFASLDRPSGHDSFLNPSSGNAFGAGFQNEFDNVSASGMRDLDDSEETGDDNDNGKTNGGLGDAWDASDHSDESSGRYTSNSGEGSVSY